MLKPNVTRADFRRIDDFVHDHKAILHVEFTPMTPCPGTALYEEKKDQVITHDWQVFDMQHFVVKTVLPQEEIFRMIVRSYTKVAMRIVRRKGLRLFFTQWGGWKWRMLHGLLAQRAALARAHRDVLESVQQAPGTSWKLSRHEGGIELHRHRAASRVPSR